MSAWTRRRPVTAYVTLAVGLSWAVWLPLLAQTQGWLDSGPWPVLHLLGSLGPAAAAVVVTAAVAGRAGWPTWGGDWSRGAAEAGRGRSPSACRRRCYWSAPASRRGWAVSPQRI
jgi:hypothetical protein